MNFSEFGLLAIGTIVSLVLVSFLFSWPVYMLWNYCLVGAVSGVNEVTGFQAWGLNMLAGLLFRTTITSKD